MSAGTRQYESGSTTTTLSGNADLTITAASTKLQIVDPGGSGRNLDLVAVDASETGVTTSCFEVYIQNEADADEDLTIRDGNNSDNQIALVHQNSGAWFKFVPDGSAGQWVSSTSGDN